MFPRGLPVGVIESIAPDPDHQPYTAIMIKPAADLARLEEVLVVTGTQTTLPAQAQQDEDMAAATANAKRAADLAADKLPSIHDDEPAAAAGATPAATAGPVVPRPLPALHPDRYTPGVTPPAADLTPGAPKGSTNPAAAPHPPESDASPKPQT